MTKNKKAHIMLNEKKKKNAKTMHEQCSTKPQRVHKQEISISYLIKDK